MTISNKIKSIIKDSIEEDLEDGNFSSAIKRIDRIGKLFNQVQQEVKISIHKDMIKQKEIVFEPYSLASKVYTEICRKIDAGEIIGVEIIANAFDLSIRTLQRRLKDSEIDFSTILDAARYNVCSHMLAETDKPINDISRQASFADRTSFTSFFKRYCGISPLQYRRMHSDGRDS